MVNNLPVNAGDVRGTCFIPGSGRYQGGGHGNPLQYSCLENPMDRGAWQATVHRVTQSQTQLKQLSRHTLLLLYYIYNLQKINRSGKIQSIYPSLSTYLPCALEQAM